MYKFCATLQNAIVHQYSRLPNTGYFLLFCFSCLMYIVLFLEKQSTVQTNINIVIRTGRLRILLATASKKLSEYTHKSTLSEIHSVFNLIKSLKEAGIKLFIMLHILTNFLLVWAWEAFQNCCFLYRKCICAGAC